MIWSAKLGLIPFAIFYVVNWYGFGGEKDPDPPI